ncbi:hypothetical protein [Methanosarcina barkeri]
MREGPDHLGSETLLKQLPEKLRFTVWVNWKKRAMRESPYFLTP